MQVLTITQINKYISSVFKGDSKLQNICIKGEISNYVHHKSGHRYFSLKDSSATIKAVMFAGYAQKLAFSPENGMSVIAEGNITLYERDGAYQINVTNIIPDGEGSASIALQQLKKRLEAEGLFAPEHKKPLPAMPRRIGAVTSLTGAAVHDIENTLERRYPFCELFEIGATVQGDNASESICRGIAKAESLGCDVIIVGRGGGASEDLNVFNDESVARAIYNCKIPVVSAVGHQIDFTLADLVADVRSSTPTEAAELVSRYDINQIRNALSNLTNNAGRAINNILEKKTAVYSTLDARLNAQSPENRLKLMSERLDNLDRTAESAVNRRIEKAESQLAGTVGRLESISPLKVMARGYSLVYNSSSLVKNASDLSVGDSIVVRFDKGFAEAEVKKTGDFYE